MAPQTVELVTLPRIFDPSFPLHADRMQPALFILPFLPLWAKVRKSHESGRPPWPHDAGRPRCRRDCAAVRRNRCRVKPSTRAYLAWTVICLVWGTTYLAIRISLETIPPLLMAAFRWLVAGALLM